MESYSQQQMKTSNQKYCSDCGKIISIKAEICPNCGVRQMPYPNPLNSTAPNGKNKIAAALLAFFLGGLGIHKFYLGRPGTGIIYILFCWTFIPSLIALIDFIILLTMRDEVFNAKYGMV